MSQILSLLHFQINFILFQACWLLDSAATWRTTDGRAGATVQQRNRGRRVNAESYFYSGSADPNSIILVKIAYMTEIAQNI